MSARGRMVTSTPATTATLNRGLTEAPRGGTRLTAPLSSHRTGVVRRTGGDGDGGTAAWKMPAPATGSRQSATARLEKPTITSTLRAASNRSRAMAEKVANPHKVRPPNGAGGDRKFTERLSIPSPRSRQTQRRAAGGGVPLPKKDNLIEAQIESCVEKQPLLETGIQTNEAEILNRDLLVGDIKLMMPSPELAKQIDKARLENKQKLDGPSLRTFAAHEQDEEQHLDELKEFMERNYVTRRVPKKPTPLSTLASYESSQYKNVFKSMDDFFTQDVPKAESITNIKERIKRKEDELMSLFDKVDISEDAESESEGD